MHQNKYIYPKLVFRHFCSLGTGIKIERKILVFSVTKTANFAFHLCSCYFEEVATLLSKLLRVIFPVLIEFYYFFQIPFTYIFFRYMHVCILWLFRSFQVPFLTLWSYLILISISKCILNFFVLFRWSWVRRRTIQHNTEIRKWHFSFQSNI